MHAARGGFGWGSDALASGAYIQTGRVVLASEVDTYVCVNCGYFEHYVADPEKLAEVAQTWAPVTPPQDSSHAD